MTAVEAGAVLFDSEVKERFAGALGRFSRAGLAALGEALGFGLGLEFHPAMEAIVVGFGRDGGGLQGQTERVSDEARGVDYTGVRAGRRPEATLASGKIRGSCWRFRVPPWKSA